MCVYIFAGRFQPFHNGHMQVFEQLCKTMLPTDILVLGVVAPFTSKCVKDEEFLEASQEHHLKERNPWDVLVPLSAVAEIARSSHYGRQIVTTLLPRPEYGWDTIVSWFPKKRVWVIPSAGEEFDEKKCDYFIKMGDSVKRFKDTTGVSGRELREFYIKGQYDAFVENVPKGLADIYFTEKPDENAENDFQKRAHTFEKKSKWVTDNNINSIPKQFFSDQNVDIEDVLDAGGGTGFLSYSLYQHLRERIKRISLVDISRNMLDKAEQKSNYPVKIHNISIETFCRMTTQKFDVVLMRQVLHYVDDVDVVIKLLKSILKSNGIIYIGQILVLDEESKNWHDELMRDISKNRRRTFIYDDFINNFIKNGFEVIEVKLTDYEEKYTDLFERRISMYEKNPKELIAKMKVLATDSLKQQMSLRFEDDNLYFTVKFCHLFLREKENV